MAQRQFPAAPPNPSAPLVPLHSGSSIPVPTTSPSILSRTQKFIEENQKLLILGAAVAVSAGAGYYLYNRQAPKDGSSGSSTSRSASPTGAGGAKKNKNKKKKKGGLKGEGLEGPLLEEVKPKADAPAKEEKKDRGALDAVPDEAGLSAMSTADRDALGKSLKDQGNRAYAKRDFMTAVECYTQAIAVSVKRDPVFYSNRAACYTNYSPPEYNKVVADCDEALKLDRNYAKALKRRANALDNLGRYEDAINDYMALNIMEEFEDSSTQETMQTVLRKACAGRAKEIMDARGPTLPSENFIAQYLGAFRPKTRPTLPENPSQGDQTLMLAFDAIEAVDYKHAFQFSSEAIEQGVSWKEGEAEAYAMRGTFKFLSGDNLGAKADLEKALDIWPAFVTAWVKIASLHMELEDRAGAFGDFEAAIRHNPNDPDIYYHRGQIYFLLQEYDQAMADYEKSIELDSTFLLPHVQHAVSRYKKQDVAAASAAFRRLLRDYPDRPEPYNYYGELLMDQQKFKEAMERFDRALELDQDRRPRNPMMHINKAVTLIQFKNDFEGAVQECKKALEVDPMSDVAITMLSQLVLQMGRSEEAAELFARSEKMVRTLPELENLLEYQYATKAQLHVVKHYPDLAAKLQPPQGAGQLPAQ